MSKLILSLDLGITSCGFSVLEELQESYRLIDYGVIMRDNPFDGNTQSDRSLHKQSRALLDKKLSRVKKIKKIFLEFGIAYEDTNYQNLWQLRAVDVFERKLSGSEFFALLRYLAKHRGYKSLKVEDLIAEIEAKEKIGNCESDEISTPDIHNFSETLAYLDALKCKHKDKTAAQIIYELESNKPNPTFRNHDDYRYMIRREDVAKELVMMVHSQQKFGFFASKEEAEDFLTQVQEIIIKQDAVTLNPDLINNCLIYKDEKCAPIFSFTFDLFNFHKLLNDLKIDGEKITQEQKAILADDFYNRLQTGKNFSGYTVKEIKKILGIESEFSKINNISEYKILKGKKVANTLVKFNFLSKLSKYDKEILESIFKQEESFLDSLSTAIHRNVNPAALLEEFYLLFEAYGMQFSKEQIQNFALTLYKEKTKGVSAYSFKALHELLDYMKEGKSESDAKEILEVGKSEDYSAFAKGIKYLKPIDKTGILQYEVDENRISNHVVKSLVSWANRLIIDLHDKYSAFDVIKLESTRELSTPEDVKSKIKSANDKNQKEWEDLKKRYKKAAETKGINLDNSSSYVLKLKLWEQQKEMGIYSLKMLSLDDILSDKTEIEHIIPRACGGSNAEYNKAVDLKNENAKKGNRIPLDYLTGEKKEQYKAFVDELKKEYKINFKKFKNLMATSLDDAYKEVRDEVSLHATSYAEKLLGEILKRYYPFKETLKQNQRVMHISGRATSYLRRILSIDNKSRDTNFHHTEDAILIALMSRSYLQKISTNFEENYEKTQEKAKENFKKIVPLIDGASPNEIFAHLRESYMEDIEDNPFYTGLDRSLRTPAYWVSKKPIGTKAHNETIQSKKNFAYRVSVESLFEKVKPNYKMSVDEFVKKYDKEIYQKLQIVQDNPKDYTAVAFRQRRDEVVKLLQEAAFITTKDEQQELNKKLLEVMRKPVFDVNGNVIRRVKRVGEVASIEVRNGLAFTAPSLVSLRCGYVEGESKLSLKRIDIRAYTKNKTTTPHEIDIFNNDLVEIYGIKSKKIYKNCFGLMKKFTSSGNRIGLGHPKYPSNLDFQPKNFKTGKARKEFSIGSSCGIKKYKTDASGKLLGFYYLGRVQHENEELFSKVLAYRRI